MSNAAPKTTPYRRLRAALHPLRVAWVSRRFHRYADMFSFKRLAAQWRLGYRFGWTQKVRAQGVAFRIVRDGAISEILRRQGSFEPDETAFLARLFRDEMTFIDAGANVGYFSLLASMLHPSATIHAFEPCLHTFDLLQANIRINGAGNIRAHRLALSNLQGTTLMTVNRDGLEGLNTLGKPAHVLSQVIGRETVVCTRLDDFLREHGIGHVDIIKADVEGAELLVLEGASDLLSQPRAPAVVFEVSGLCETGFGHSAQRVMDFLSNCGYKLYRLDGNKLSVLPAWDGHGCTAVALKGERAETLFHASTNT